MGRRVRKITQREGGKKGDRERILVVDKAGAALGEISNSKVVASSHHSLPVPVAEVPSRTIWRTFFCQSVMFSWSI